MKKRSAYELCLFLSTLLATALGVPAVHGQSTVAQHNYAGLIITGTPGNTYPIQYVTSMGKSNAWTTLTNLVLPSSPYLFVDTSAADPGQRYYRETNVTFTLQNCVGLTIAGTVGSTNMIQYVELSGNTNNWVTLTNLVLSSNPQIFIDTVSQAPAKRRYRAEDLAGPPAITSPNLGLGQINLPFSYQITASSYLPITGYAASGLPPGLTINSSSGVISGTPTQLGTNAVSISASNSTGPGSISFSLAIRTSLATELVSIPAGSFTMGSPATELDRDPNEGPQAQVTLTHAFSMGKYEVSQLEYLAVVGVNPSFYSSDLTRPVTDLNWQDATNFCAMLTARDRASGLISPTAFYRLPTEAEWEYAARAGTTTRYSFGDDAALLGQYGWFKLNSTSITHPVGQKLPNPWGLYDMAGNSWEFCRDWYGPYSGGTLTDPQGAGTGSLRVVRGGSAFFAAIYCRSAIRSGVFPDVGRYSDLGFRIVLNP